MLGAKRSVLFEQRSEEVEKASLGRGTSWCKGSGARGRGLEEAAVLGAGRAKVSGVRSWGVAGRLPGRGLWLLL